MIELEPTAAGYRVPLDVIEAAEDDPAGFWQLLCSLAEDGCEEAIEEAIEWSRFTDEAKDEMRRMIYERMDVVFKTDVPLEEQIVQRVAREKADAELVSMSAALDFASTLADIRALPTVPVRRPRSRASSRRVVRPSSSDDDPSEPAGLPCAECGRPASGERCTPECRRQL